MVSYGTDVPVRSNVIADAILYIGVGKNLMSYAAIGIPARGTGNDYARTAVLNGTSLTSSSKCRMDFTASRDGNGIGGRVTYDQGAMMIRILSWEGDPENGIYILDSYSLLNCSQRSRIRLSDHALPFEVLSFDYDVKNNRLLVLGEPSHQKLVLYKLNARTGAVTVVDRAIIFRQYEFLHANWNVGDPQYDGHYLLQNALGGNFLDFFIPGTGEVKTDFTLAAGQQDVPFDILSWFIDK